MNSSSGSFASVRQRTRKWLIAAVVAGLSGSAAYADPTSLTVGDTTANVNDGAATTMSFPITRSGDLSYPVGVSYDTYDETNGVGPPVEGAAVEGTDYTYTGGTLMIPAGASSARVDVPILSQSGSQADKTFKMALGAAAGLGPAISFSTAVASGVGTAPQSLATGDFNGDGKPDLAVANSGANTVTVLLDTTAPGATTPRFAASPALAVGKLPDFVAVGDFNLDGKPDLAVANQSDNNVSILINATAPGASTAVFSPAITVAVGSGPSAIAVADFDGDGKPDLAVSNLNAGSVSVLLNTGSAGSASFQLASSPGVGTRPSSVVAGDFNGDGRPDLAVANAGDNTVSILYASVQSDPNVPNKYVVSFNPSQTVATGSAPTAMTVADFNSDGRPDLAVGNQGDGTVLLVYNLLPGYFTTGAAVAVGSAPLCVNAGDFNGDGRPDLAVSNPNSGTVSVLYNNGFGLALARTISAGRSPHAVASGDFNGDGRPDLAVANSDDNSLAVLINNTAMPGMLVDPGSFTVLSPYYPVDGPLNGNTLKTICVDLNGDGKPDCVVLRDSYLTVYTNAFYAGSTPYTSSFQASGSNQIGSSGDIASADLNGDAKPDLLITNPSSNTLAVLINKTAAGGNPASFYDPQSITSKGSAGLAVADFNGDGLQDVVVGGYGDNDVSVLLNRTQPGPMATLANFAAPQTFATGTYPDQPIAADLNGDGKPDIVVGFDDATTGLSVLLNTTATGASTASFSAAQTIDTSARPTAKYVRDLNGDGKPDLIYGVGNVAVRLNTTAPGAKTASFSAEQRFSSVSSANIVSVSDFDGDGRPDIALGSSDSPSGVSLLINTTAPGASTASFTEQPIRAANNAIPNLAGIDLNSDGKPDLAFSDYGYGTVSTLVNAQLQATVPSAAATGTIHYDPSRAATPKLSLAPGAYKTAQTLTISDSTSGAAIRYTVDGTTPSSSSPLYSSAISVSKTETVKAIAIASGYSSSAVASADYTISTVTATPTFSPQAGNYPSALAVVLSDTTPGASIYYTTDGSTPTTASTLYASPIKVSQAQTIKAIGVASGYTSSPVASAPYKILPPAPQPGFDPQAGHYPGVQTVTISDTAAGSTIYYTTDGSTPTTGSTRYTGPITIGHDEEVQAFATSPDYSPSNVSIADYDLDVQAPPPTFSPAAGTYATPQMITLSDSLAGASIVYTTDGSDPNNYLTPTTKYTGPISVSQSQVIKAAANATGYNASNTATAAYTLSNSLPAPTFTPAGGSYANSVSVTISDAKAGTAIYYTIDGSMPTTSSPRYAGPIKLTYSTAVKAFAQLSGYNNSPVATSAFTIQPQITAPTFSPAAGSYTSTQTVTISDSTYGAKIYYTINGSTPTTASTPYTGAITVDPNETIKAFAVGDGYSDSAVASATYSLAARVATPTVSPASGTYTSWQIVTISDSMPGAKIYYTVDGSTPTTSSTVYLAPIMLSTTQTIKAMAVASGYQNSLVASVVYTIVQPAATPAFSPAAGTYTSTQSVTISDSTAGAKIYYTSDGSTPTASSTLYSAPISVSKTQTIQAIAIASGYQNSSMATAAYTIVLPAAAPIFSPAGGTYMATQSVSIGDATAGATVRYTIDGSTPTASSPAYSGPITVSRTQTIKAIAIASGYSNSAVASASYTILLNPPVFDPVSGTYPTSQNVKITDASAGVTIYYTVDGSAPTSSSIAYTGPISVSRNTTIKAIAAASGLNDSTVTTASYTILAAPPTFSPAGGTYLLLQSVTISDTTPGATIYYTIDGSTPTTSSTRYTGPITVSHSETVKAIAVANGYGNSPVTTASYTITVGL